MENFGEINLRGRLDAVMEFEDEEPYKLGVLQSVGESQVFTFTHFTDKGGTVQWCKNVCESMTVRYLYADNTLIIYNYIMYNDDSQTSYSEHDNDMKTQEQYVKVFTQPTYFCSSDADLSVG